MFIRRWLYFISVFVLTLGAAWCLPSLAGKCWLAGAVFFLVLITTGNTFSARIICILFTGVGMSLAVLLSSFFVNNDAALAVYLWIMTACLVSAMWHWHQYRLSCLLINLFAFFALLPGVEQIVLKDGAESMLLGTLIVIVSQLLFWPHFISNQIKQTLRAGVRGLQGLGNDVFFCLLQTDYPNKIYLFENRIHMQKTKIMRVRKRLYSLIEGNKKINMTKKEMLQELAEHFDVLYESFINCAQVRWRTTDHTIFAVCEHDLLSILQEINKIYEEFIVLLFAHTSIYLDLNTLQMRINQFEQTYQNVLQVSAREPVVLLFFVMSLQMFARELNGFNDKLMAARAIFK